MLSDSFSFKLFVFVLATFVISCSSNKPNPPADLIEQEKFSLILAEFELIQSSFNIYPDTTKAVSIRDSVLKHYEITLEQFYSSELYYHNDIVLYQQLLNSAMDRLSEEQSILLETKKPVDD